MLSPSLTGTIIIISLFCFNVFVVFNLLDNLLFCDPHG